MSYVYTHAMGQRRQKEDKKVPKASFVLGIFRQVEQVRLMLSIF